MPCYILRSVSRITLKYIVFLVFQRCGGMLKRDENFPFVQIMTGTIRDGRALDVRMKTRLTESRERGKGSTLSEISRWVSDGKGSEGDPTIPDKAEVSEFSTPVKVLHSHSRWQGVSGRMDLDGRGGHVR